MKIVVLADVPEYWAVGGAVRLGAMGVVVKSSTATGIVEAVRAAAREGSWFDPEATAAYLRWVGGPGSDDPLAKLTPQQQRVLWLVAEGMTSKQIADQLGLSVKTVKNYTAHLLHRLGLERRTQAAALAARVSERRARDCGPFAGDDGRRRLVTV